MIVVQNSKLSTVVIWASVIVIFLLLGMLALMAGVMYSKQVKLERSLEEGPQQLAEKTVVPEPRIQKNSQPQPVAPSVEPEKPVVAQPADKQLASAPVNVKTIYVLINGKLVPLEVEDQGVSEARQLTREAMQASKEETLGKPTAVQELGAEKLKASIARKTGVVDAGDMANRVLLSQTDIEETDQPENLKQLQQVALMAAYQQRKQKEVASVLRGAEKAKHEERFIRVKPGDSLWRIAVRAYGNGFMYKKILAANPQIRNPDSLTVGMLLRVPE